ncbi:cytochrome P450, partial [Stereum hirsutum FP-91666 SS1]|uniref:cytochrome P450 n=1 Tax=Stereum hirsutum (strain FP-91666) TaxID=721885 RepID=UPI0004449838
LSIHAGNYHQIFQDGLEYNLSLAEKYGGAVKIYALLGNEQLYVSDPRALHHIVVKEQDVYEETDMFIIGNRLIFGEGLISTLGEQHRKQRKMLNPVFSMGNMRELLPTIQPIASQLCAVITSQLPNPKEIDLLPLISRGALEYVAQAVLGYSFGALDSSETVEYAEAIRSFTPAALRLVFLRPFIPFIVRKFSLYWRNKMVAWIPVKPLKDLKRIVEVMDRSSRAIFEQKKASVGDHADDITVYPATIKDSAFGKRTKGRDIMSIMSMSVHYHLDFFMLQSRYFHSARQCLIVRDAELPYDVLMGLPFLDAVIRETLRVHPPTNVLSRTARKATTLPLQYPIRSSSGTKINAIPVPKNTTVIVSILAANHNPKVWGEDASVWKPERWLAASGEHASGTRADVKYPGVYGSMMTFLGGGRACIGFKFAEMEMKQVMATLLTVVHFSLPSTPDETGHIKEIYWKTNAVQVPVVRPPSGDGQTPQVPLDVRLVREDDYL